VDVSYQTVDYRRDGKVVYITLNRPEVLNAVDELMEAELREAFREYDLDEEAWVAILDGSGRCFCSGFDVKQRFADMPDQERTRWSSGANSEGYLGRSVNWKPVIAAVHSYALGAGINIALECDLIAASEDALFGITETKRGLPAGTVWAKAQTFMPSKVATELLLTGEPMPASELYRLGMINRLAPAGHHVEAAEELASNILKAPPLAVRAGVRISRWTWVRMSAEADLYLQPLKLHLTEDFQESSRSFVEKRRPSYRGR
jgi:enoyl-CoA hydratase/carnithine racemase